MDQFKKTNPNIQLPEVKKFDNGGYFAEFDINDPPARWVDLKLSNLVYQTSVFGSCCLFLFFCVFTVDVFL